MNSRIEVVSERAFNARMATLQSFMDPRTHIARRRPRMHAMRGVPFAAVVSSGAGNARPVAGPPGGGGGTDPFSLWPALDLNTIPFHVEAGDWGPQRTVTAPTQPTGGAAVDVSSVGAFESAWAAGNRTIRLTGDVSGGTFASQTLVEGNGSNCIVNLNGFKLKNIIFGPASPGNGGPFRFQSNSLGTYDVNSRLHFLTFYDGFNYGTFRDISITGPAQNGLGDTAAISAGGSTLHSNWALINTCVAAGCSAFTWTTGNIISCGNVILTGLIDPAPSSDAEAWGFRHAFETNGYVIHFQDDIRSHTRSSFAYSRIRFHPDAGFEYGWIDNCTLIERVESWILWCHAAAGGGSGDANGIWLTNNNIIAGGGSPRILIGDANYARVTGNTIQSNTILSNANINFNPDPGNASAVGNSGASGNTFQSLPGSDPAYGTKNPTVLDWNI